MKVTVLGANGQTGQEIVSALLRRNHTVVAAVRRPETVTPTENLTVAKVDIGDQNSLTAAITGSDAVVSALGTGSLKQARAKTDLYSTAVRALRTAMRATGVKRLIVLSSGGVDEEDAAPWFYNALIRRYLMNTYVDMARMETILEESEDLDWTSVRLTYLVEGESKEFLVEDRQLGRGNFKITFRDAGEFVAKEAEEGKWIKKMPVLGYP